MNQSYRIELATENHLPAIPGIEQAATAIFSEADLPPEVRYLVTDPQTLAEAQREQRLWTALNSDNSVVGFAMTCVVGGFAHLEEMDVHPDHGRQGIGADLLTAAIGWARTGEFPGISLITFRHLPWNAPFYERHGFVRLDDENTSSALRELICEDGDAGLEPGKRVAMVYVFNDGSGSGGVGRLT